MEDVALGRRKAIEELVGGREFANQLLQVINGDDESATATPFAQHLVRNVLKSFSNTLFFLNKYPTYESHEVSQMQVRDSCLIGPAKSEDSQEGCKSSTIKDRRDCYTRRRTTETWEKVWETPTDDGHQWRKYGPKAILNAKYSRNYYRCTHKFDQGCQAAKQVQRVQEEPPLYKTTYYGHHSYRKLLNPEIILDSTSSSDSSILLSFNNTFPTPTKQDCPFLSSFLSPSVKKECNKEEVPSSSSDVYLLSPELTLDNSSRHVTLSPTLESDHKDVMSGILYSSVELDLDDVFRPFVGF